MSLLKTGALTAGLKILSQILVIVSGIVLARFLGPDDYGIYAFSMALVGMFILVAQLGFTTFSVKQISAYETNNDWVSLRSYMMYAVVFVSIGSSLIALLALFYFEYLANQSQSNFVVLALILIPVSALFRVFQSFMNGFQFIGQAESIKLARQAFFLLLCGAVILFGFELFDPEVVLLAQALSTSIGLLICFLYIYKRAPVEIFSSFKYRHSSLWLPGAISFIMLSTVNYINTQTDILILGVFREGAEVGIYRVASQAAALMGFVSQIVLLIAGPIIARLYVRKNNKELQQLVANSTRIVFVFSLFMFVFFWVLGRELLDLLFGSDFVVAEAPLLALCVGKLLASIFACAAIVLNMCGFEKSTTKILLISALLNVILNYTLVPEYGAMGAAVSTSFVAALSAYLMYREVWQKTSIDSSPLNRSIA